MIDLTLTREAASRQAPFETPRADNQTIGSALWTPDKLRQLSSALLMELFRRTFEFESEERDKEGEDPRERRRRYDKLFALGVIGSYGFGRAYAEFRDIYHLLEFLKGMGRGTAYRALKDLRGRRVMWQVNHPREALRLFVNPRVEGWILDKRIQDEDWRNKLREWATLYRTVQTELVIPDMPLPDQTIMEALAEVNLTAAVKEVPQGNLGAAPAAVDQVPLGNLQFPWGTRRGSPGEPAQRARRTDARSGDLAQSAELTGSSIAITSPTPDEQPSHVEESSSLPRESDELPPHESAVSRDVWDWLNQACPSLSRQIHEVQKEWWTLCELNPLYVNGAIRTQFLLLRRRPPEEDRLPLLAQKVRADGEFPARKPPSPAEAAPWFAQARQLIGS